MRFLIRTLLISSAALLGVAEPSYAQNCRDDLVSARIGMIEMDGSVQAEAISSREAISLIGSGSGLNFQRVIDDFWRIKVKRSVDASDLEVTYRIDGGDDRSGRATHLDNDAQGFPVRLIPITPRLLCENFSHRIFSGGFTALGHASGIGLAGIYSLAIDVDVRER